MADTYRVVAIRAAAGGQATFVLESEAPNQLVLSSLSAVVQTAVLGAFLVGGEVVLETEGMTNFVKRVDAFGAGKGPSPYPSEYRVNRVATQRGADGVDHLEVFLLKGNDAHEIPCNVYDPLLQQLLMAAFTHYQSPTSPKNVALNVIVDNMVIVGVGLGKP